MVEFKLPDVGEGMHEGEIIQWFIEEGDLVNQDDPVLEVQTDKVNAELTAPAGGKVTKIYYPIGEVVQVGSLLFTIDGEHVDGGSVEEDNSLGTSTVESKERAIPSTGSHLQNRHALATPFVRQKAREMGVDLEEVSGTGPAGRVTEQDLQLYNSQPTSANITPANTDREHDTREKRVPLKGIRRAIAEQMTKSVNAIPHVTHTEELEMDTLHYLRQEWNQLLKEQGEKVTYLPFIVKSVAVALREFEIINASLDDEKQEIILHRSYHIGIAADTSEGLLVPVIHDADKKTILEISTEIRRLADAARNGKLKAADMKGSTFTISNMGPIGSTTATPIINHPEAAILALHKMEPKMVVRNWEGVVRYMMNISLSFDHRLIDGSTAVKFTNRLKELLENPTFLLLELR